MSFPPDTLQRLRDTREVRIETTRGSGAPVHRTVIWVVVDDRDRVLIRTYRGPRSRWYREALANPTCTLWLGATPVAVLVEPAIDDDRVAAASDALLAKYRGAPEAMAMVADELLPTTLELLPR